MLLVPPGREIANWALLKIWARKIDVVSDHVASVFLQPLMFFRALRIETIEAVVRSPANYPQIVGLLNPNESNLQMTTEEKAICEKTLREMGLPKGAWFVSVHSRESTYSPKDAAHNDSRNCNISNYEGAVDQILKRGGWCIRVGEPGGQELAKRPGVINYHNSPFKSDLMDLYLCLENRFFLGNTSGLYTVSVVGGKPCALANMVPLGACYGFGRDSISIPKTLSTRDGKKLHFKYIFSSRLSDFSYSFVEDRNLIIIENSAEEIRELAAEMLDVLDGCKIYSEHDQALQESFRRLVGPQHYTYGASGRIGSAFLRSHEGLL